MTSQFVRLEKRDHVLRITIDRDRHRNALSPDDMTFVSRACAEAEKDDEVRVVVLTGNDEGFCAGVDLSEADLSASGGQIPPVRFDSNVWYELSELCSWTSIYPVA